MGRRNSSPRAIEERGRRPNLRSCATGPSITASNVSRGAFASPHSAQRAADLLTRVAVFTAPGGVVDLPSRPVTSPSSSLSSRGSAESYIGSRAVDMPPKPPRQGDSLDGSPASDTGSYFSFPNFDDWEGENGDKADEENAEFST
ncbi:hypothetical protein ACRALDRAFT_1062923 [Sodiomyces alcalophilus JCM 7366]|uniref:uncharacterized protein n=1 Tax=Sodiomyces alcalophilus JCM 7366 TaxID=591952 RepID=UPI0039B5C1E9